LAQPGEASTFIGDLESEPKRQKDPLVSVFSTEMFFNIALVGSRSEGKIEREV
jgi:hypothetical protein